ncbi:MAG: hypothetical protein GF398_16920 [Chitinivibrionales bacterium]|nr:hypothetical protein [Chitinivibrionales bacterium]
MIQMRYSFRSEMASFEVIGVTNNVDAKWDIVFEGGIGQGERYAMLLCPSANIYRATSFPAFSTKAI